MPFPPRLVTHSLGAALFVCMLAACATATKIPYTSHEGATLFNLVRNPKVESLIKASPYANYLALKNINELSKNDRKLAFRHESHSKQDPSALTRISYYFAFNEAVDQVVNGSSPSAYYYMNLVCSMDGTVLGMEYYSRNPR